MKLKEHFLGEPSILFEISKLNPSWAVLFAARLLDGTPAIEEIHHQLITNEYLENFLIMGDPGVGKTTFFRQLLDYLQHGPYQHEQPFEFMTMSYDPYSLAFTEGDESPEEKEKLREEMNKIMIKDFNKMNQTAKYKRKNGARTFKVIEMPVKGKLNRGRDLARHLNKPLFKSRPKNRTLVIALESVTSLFDHSAMCRTIITNESDGWKMQQALQEIGVTIPKFQPDNPEYLQRLKKTVQAMARAEQIFSVRHESLEEAKHVIQQTKNISELFDLIASMEVLKQFGEREQVELQQHLLYLYRLLYSQEFRINGYGLGFWPKFALIVINNLVSQVMYDPLGEMTD